MLRKIAFLATSALAGLAMVWAKPAFAADDVAVSIGKLTVAADTLWVLVTAMLVFFMNLGFGLVESGFQSSKNCVNILSKNFVVFAVTSVGFWYLGWGLMFGNGTPWMGQEGLWAVSGADNSPATGAAYAGAYPSLNWTGVPLYAKFFFQLVFAGTAATIVSGAVGGRIKYFSFILFSLAMAIVLYPITGHWIWGGGYLAGKGFLDFAGSTVVHSVGGWAALTGALILGPRFGRFGPKGEVSAIPGHNMTSAVTGVLVLWLGWFGFNPGSTMGIVSDGGATAAHVALTTNTAAALGTLAATFLSWMLLGKPDLGMTLNGCLAGLVAITAPCAFVTINGAIVIGLVAGVFVVFATIGLDKIGIDDPVGAVPVHLVNGIWGTLALGLFADPAACPGASVVKPGLLNGGGMAQFMPQLQGVIAVGIYTLIVSAVVWYVLKLTVGIRVTPEEEMGGLDIGEHGNMAYPDFVTRKFSPSPASSGRSGS